MAWWQLSIQCSAAELEQTESVLLELGALSINISDAKDEPIYEPLPGHTPVWQNSIVTGMFDSQLHPEQLYQSLSERLPEHLLGSLRQNQLEDQDWVQAYRDHYFPIQCADRLWIVPSWHQAPDPAAINIILDPGLAFGTGGHPTTALCLAWLAENAIQNQSVIDYGCGSGILAIAACKLGATTVLGVDIDPQALDASRENARRNQITTEQFQLSLPDSMDRSTVDLLIANILSGPLVELAESLAALVKPGGKILLSGILQQQANEIQSAYQVYFNIEPVLAKENWIRVTGTRKNDQENTSR
ncbi:MAG: 50S ribosomal protein L11 methyltransferase [Gammaproteobacteria bacterium]|nr:50S ribosomal protein L11 methyltransferase [Gammaproteobacteria bacterium]